MPDFFVCEIGLDGCLFDVQQSAFFVFGEGVADELGEFGQGDPFKYYVCGTEGVGLVADVFEPTAPGIVFEVSDEIGLEWVLVDPSTSSG